MKKSLPTKPLPTSRVTMSSPGNVRLGPLLSIPVVLRELGIDPRHAFAQAGVDASLFDDADSRMRLEDAARLVEACVARTGCAHFGLLVGERFDLKAFGPLGTLMRNSPTVGDALHSLVRHFHVHDRGAAPVLLRSEGSSVILGYSVYRHSVQASAQVYDTAIAIAHRMLVEMCGPTWRARQVQFSHARPRSVGPYRRLFGPNLGFDADVSGIVFDSSWLDKPIEGADAQLHVLVAKSIREAEAQAPISFGEQVQGMLHQMVLSGMASGAAVAGLFAIHERTLRRRLADEGTSLNQLIQRTRFELAQQLLRNTGLAVSEVATALQYRDANAFSRAFRHWAGVSATEWRAGH